MIQLKDFNTVSNYISFLRLFLAVPFFYLLDNFESESYRYIAFGLALFAAFTDILDGFLARKLNQVTEAGKIIDPIADKVCVIVIIVKLYLIGEIPDYYFYMILGRDLLIFIGGILVSRMLGRVLPSNVIGKITVIVIGILILLIMLRIDKNSIYYLTTYWISTILIFASLVAYLIRAYEFIKKRNYGSI